MVQYSYLDLMITVDDKVIEGEEVYTVSKIARVVKYDKANNRTTT